MLKLMYRDWLTSSATEDIGMLKGCHAEDSAPQPMLGPERVSGFYSRNESLL